MKQHLSFTSEFIFSFLLEVQRVCKTEEQERAFKDQPEIILKLKRNTILFFYSFFVKKEPFESHKMFCLLYSFSERESMKINKKLI